MSAKSGSDLFIVDNSDREWKVLQYLHDWCSLAQGLDVAAGYFEIGALLGLEGQWQQVDRIRILMGDEASRRTRDALVEGLKEIHQRLDGSLELEKEGNDFLAGVPAIVEALRTGKITCRVYKKNKFHAKAYITHARHAVMGSTALVGSSNFTLPGLTQNVELNVQITGPEVKILQDWYEEHWNLAEDVTPDILRIIERHTRDYSPFEIYAKSLQEYFRGHEMTPDEWEKTQSRMYPRLDQYQKEGYQAMMQIAKQYGGALLCDGVGLGKTYVGLMLIERLIWERKRVVLFVPKSARDDVWERDLRKYLWHLRGLYTSLTVFNHTDLGREGDYPGFFQEITERVDAVVIDEAHHFRNPGIEGRGERKPSRYRKLFDLIDGPNGPKQVFMLTATPVNNSLHDFRHMIELFSRRDDGYFKNRMGVHSLRGHFISLEKELRKQMEGNGEGPRQTDLLEAEKVLAKDRLFEALVVQRSRDYVRKSQLQQGDSPTCFPTREAPKVVDYSVKKTYDRLLGMVEKAFAKDDPLFVLGIYYPLGYYKGPDNTIDPLAEGRQKQVVSLIRTQFLKRFESSARAFEYSCDRLLVKLLAWVERHVETDEEQRRLHRWKTKFADLIGYVGQCQRELWGESEDEAEEDLISEEMLEAIPKLERDEYKVGEIIGDTIDDLYQIAEFLEELRKFEPKHDDKLAALVRLLKTDPVLKAHKVLIFTEFADTARYLKKQLTEKGIEGVEQVDSGSKKSLGEVIRRFSPYYNGSSSELLAAEGKSEIRVLISTDVLSEGLNLQDATRLINYDLHWNPVRLMQRIGRVDRRMNPEVEEQMLADHPEYRPLRGKVEYWNFLPPEDLEGLLSLYARVAHKVLRISKTLGIEGEKLLRPEDDYEALKLFNEQMEGTTTPVQDLHLEFRQLLKDHPDLEGRLEALPGRVFSGKRHPRPGTQGVFFCYRMPLPDHFAPLEEGGHPWTEAAGETQWYLYRLEDGYIFSDPTEIAAWIRSAPDTPREIRLESPTLREIRLKVEKHIRNNFQKQVQMPQDIRPLLKTWMELN
ncbi:MAG: helicase [Desulfobacteraceae bacterium]|nr:MAG: helicase [Desulfobacteraceae bacterium]